MVRNRLALSLLGVVCAKVYFVEEFTDGWRDRWIDSKWKESEGTQGRWEVSQVNDNEPLLGQGLKTAEDSKFFGISSSFDSFSNKGKQLVLQFQIKIAQDIQCGGGYIKMGPKPEDMTSFGDPTPYYIMFGPDQCGSSNMHVHLIFNYKGKNHLKKSKISWKDDHMSHLLTLVIDPDNSYKVFVDQKQEASGSLTEDWDFLPAKKINDPSVSKPSDWVDEAQILDPNDVKPDDWVEEATIVDASAEKPADWDEEEDGAWQAPTVPNPEYKGPWTQKKIANPDYKGPWVHPQIDNPEYVVDDTIYAYDDIGFVGFDLWQVKGGTVFDNIIVTDSLEEAKELGERTWKPIHDLEVKLKAEEDAAKAKLAEDAAKKEEDDDDDLDDDDSSSSSKKTEHDEF